MSSGCAVALVSVPFPEDVPCPQRSGRKPVWGECPAGGHRPAAEALALAGSTAVEHRQGLSPVNLSSPGSRPAPGDLHGCGDGCLLPPILCDCRNLSHVL